MDPSPTGLPDWGQAAFDPARPDRSQNGQRFEDDADRACTVLGPNDRLGRRAPAP